MNILFNKTPSTLIDIRLFTSQKAIMLRIYMNLLLNLSLGLHFYVRSMSFSEVQDLCELLYSFFDHLKKKAF